MYCNREERMRGLGWITSFVVCLFCHSGLSRAVLGCERPQGCCDAPYNDYTVVEPDCIHGARDNNTDCIIEDEDENKLKITYGTADCGPNSCGDNLNAFKIYYNHNDNDNFVGECPYAGGINVVLYKKDASGVFECIVHRSADNYCGGPGNSSAVLENPPGSGEYSLFTDDNCNDAKDWVVNIYDCPNTTPYRYWREGPCDAWGDPNDAGWEVLSDTEGAEVYTSGADCGRICGGSGPGGCPP